ncbi:MAG: cation:proton antiporter [Vicinamibacterales bacterium]|nr:cation:proton antiporter [Vicinamibacterales bacterium]
MRRAAALVLLLLTVIVLRRAMDGDTAADLRGTALAFGFALIAATLAGELFERLRLPRISGYLLFGLACGPFAADLISRTMASDLQIINGLAIALIAFIAGLEINFVRIRSRLGAILAVGGAAVLVPFMVLEMVLFLAWPWLPIAPDATGLTRLGMTLVLTTVLVSFSPTVTIAVITESRTRGPLSELVLSVVVLADLALILGFTLVMQFMRSVNGATGDAGVGLLPFLVWDIFGSFAFGAIIGAAFALYLRIVGRELTLVLLAVCVLMSAAGEVLHFEPLLSALAAGLVVENIAPPQGDAMKHAVERSALPVLVIFFVAAGASIHVDALMELGGIAVGLALLRAFSIWMGVGLGVARAGLSHTGASMAWMGLVSQAGVTLGLTIIVASEFPGWGTRVQTLVVAMIALHELAGPVLFRMALARAGEVGGMDRPGGLTGSARPA